MKQWRIIVDTDAKNEADDQYAVVHALLSPSLDVRGIVPAHFGTRRTERSMLESREEVDHLLDLMSRTGSVTVANGAAQALPDERTPVPSAGSRLIVEEALKENEGPLFLAFLGPLTDLASALLEEPSIQDRPVVVVWVGGPPYGTTKPAYGPEFNLINDVHAANVVFGSRLTVWQIPMSVYTRVGVGYAELEEKVRPHGRLGEYLVSQLVAVNETLVPIPMEFRSLGDNPAIGVVMNPNAATWREWPRPVFTAEGNAVPRRASERTVQVCEELDTRWLLEDLFAKIRRSATADSPRG